MKVTFDKEGYVEMLVMKGDLPNSIELPDDNTLNYKYLNCYKLGFDGNQLVLDAKKVQRLESNLTAESLIYDLEKQLYASDYKVLRHLREQALGIETTKTEEEYYQLEAERESLTRKMREIKNGEKLETDPYAILQEGHAKREEKKKEKNNTKNIVEKFSTEELINEIIEKVVKEISKKFNFGSLFNVNENTEEAEKTEEVENASKPEEEKTTKTTKKSTKKTTTTETNGEE